MRTTGSAGAAGGGANTPPYTQRALLSQRSCYDISDI